MSTYRWVASLGIGLALCSATVHYTVAPPSAGTGVVAYVDDLGPVWSLLFGTALVFLVVTLAVGRARFAAHVAAAAALSTYAAALWGTVIVSGQSRGVVTAGLATALCIHALLLATVYSPRGAAWTRQ